MHLRIVKGKFLAFFLTAYLVFVVEAGSDKCYFYKNQIECEKAEGGKDHYLLNYADSEECVCEC